MILTVSRVTEHETPNDNELVEPSAGNMKERTILELDGAAQTERLSQLASVYPTHHRQRRSRHEREADRSTLIELLFQIWVVFVTLVIVVVATVAISETMS